MLKAAVIGLGRIGSTLDASGTPTPLTHAGGFAAHPEFELVAVCDSDAARNRSEAKRWGTAAFASVSQAMAETRPDVVSICTPTETHLDTLRQVVEFHPGCVIMEKPLGPNMDSARELVRLCESREIPLLVHIPRRFIPLYESLRRKIRNGSRAVSASIKYAKGIRHNGFHAVALMLSMFGEAQEATPLAVRRDFFPDDPTVSLHFQCERCDDVHFQALDERLFTHFEFDVILEDGRYTFYKDDFAALRHEVQWNEQYQCQSLRPVGEEGTGKEQAMLELLNHAADMIRNGTPSCCDGRFALKVQAMCEAILDHVQDNDHADH
ncbi:Gfo/Idh/MocA family protein [Pseudodesulfovibrio tunisiensis]|uniref:Gfo/Idh/MocA family protein n=1 Tax=Pseudodesulfovibrio tunisiensis TaxID=463192 RepID=UPI001FB3268B|nr:Gfo/Idh/MocA family oxidoreductase [Pseudodesulfovibrio tunisiensis]